MNVSPVGGGHITSDAFESPALYPAIFTCAETYTLTAHPATTTGYEFIHWTVDSQDAGTIATGNPLAVSVADSSKTVTAYFRVAGTENQPPAADAGEDQTVNRGDRVVLDGSGSFDPDDDIRSHLWQQTAGAGVTLSEAATVSPAFIAPEVADNPAMLTFQLTVEDYAGATAAAFVTITIDRNMLGDQHGGGGGGCFISEAVR